MTTTTIRSLAIRFLQKPRTTQKGIIADLGLREPKDRDISLVDGYGRSVKHTGLHEYQLTPVRPKPKPTFTVEFKVENGMSEHIFDLLSGRESHGT